MDPEERTETDIIEEAVDHIVYDKSGENELLEILERYHTPNIAVLLSKAIKTEAYWANTDEAQAWRQEIEDMVRDHIRDVRRRAHTDDY